MSISSKCDRHSHEHIDTVSGARAVGNGALGVFGVLDTFSYPGLTERGFNSRWVHAKAQCSRLTRTVDRDDYGGAIVNVEKGANQGKRRQESFISA